MEISIRRRQTYIFSITHWWLVHNQKIRHFVFNPPGIHTNILVLDKISSLSRNAKKPRKGNFPYTPGGLLFSIMQLFF
jgi:hypothetical protein